MPELPGDDVEVAPSVVELRVHLSHSLRHYYLQLQRNRARKQHELLT